MLLNTSVSLNCFLVTIGVDGDRLSSKFNPENPKNLHLCLKNKDGEKIIKVFALTSPLNKQVLNFF